MSTVPQDQPAGSEREAGVPRVHLDRAAPVWSALESGDRGCVQGVRTRTASRRSVMSAELPHRERRQVMTCVAALAAIAFALGLYVVQRPPEDPVRRAVVRPAMAVGRLIGIGGDARPPIGEAIRRVGQGDENARAVAVLQLRYEATDSARFAQVATGAVCGRCMTVPGPSRTPPCPCSATSSLGTAGTTRVTGLRGRHPDSSRPWSN